AEHFLACACADYGVGNKTLTPDARAALLAFPWPGNIRELANLMERVALLDDGSSVAVDVLSLPQVPAGTGTVVAASSVSERASFRHGPRRVPDRAQLVAAFEATRGNVAQTAARLGIPRGTLRYQLEKLGLSTRTPAPTSREPDAPTTAARESAGPLR